MPRLTILPLVFLSAAAPTRLYAAAPPFDMDQAAAEVTHSYSHAEPEVQEFVLHTARTFGPAGMLMNENAYTALTPAERDARVVYLAKLSEEAESGRHLCAGLARASR